MMRETIKGIGAAFLAGAFLMVPVLGVLQQNNLVEAMPDDEGRGLVRNACASCHSLDQVLMQRMTEEDWAQTVEEMIGRGAQIFPDEKGLIVGYLSKHYGPARSDARETSAGGGQELLAEKCYQCHGAGMWRDLRQDKRAWVGTLYRMVGRGALWTEEEIEKMAGHLAQINGPSGR